MSLARHVGGEEETDEKEASRWVRLTSDDDLDLGRRDDDLVFPSRRRKIEAGAVC